MPLNSYFYDSVNGDRPYSAADFAKAFGIILTNGIIPSSVDSALGFGWATNYTTIGAGRATIQGHFVELTEATPLTIPTVPASFSGMVVIRLDIAEARIGSLAVRTDQTPQQDNSVYELPLFNVTVANGVITAVTDVRVQGGAVAKMPSNVPTFFYRDNGVYLQLGNYSIALTPAQPPASAKRVWIQIDN